MLHSKDDIERWILHSVTHFCIENPDKRKIKPPKKNSCPVCHKEFKDDDPMVSWSNKMHHLIVHYEEGKTLPDFDLFHYLWTQGVIKQDEFRYLWGPSKNMSAMQNGHQAGTQNQDQDEDEQSRAVIEVHSNSRRRRHQ